MLNNLDLFKVRLIDALVTHGSLSDAAKSLRITSSAVSQNIRSLEKILGKPLFIRVGKKIKPTPLALALSKCSRPFFAELSLILQNSNEHVAEVKIGAPPIYATTTLVQEIKRIHKTFPSVRVCISSLDTHRIVSELIDGKIDFGIVDEGPYLKTIREIVTTELCIEELVLCCSKNFFNKYLKGNVSINTLKALPHIPYHADKEGVHKWYLHHYAKVPDYNWKLSVDHPYGIRTAILNDQGLSVLPKSLVDEQARQFHIIQGPKNALKSKMLLIQNKGRIPTKIEKGIISLLTNP